MNFSPTAKLIIETVHALADRGVFMPITVAREAGLQFEVLQRDDRIWLWIISSSNRSGQGLKPLPVEDFFKEQPQQFELVVRSDAA